MKLNGYFLLFTGVGIILGFILPLSAGDTQGLFTIISQIAFNMATWALIPLFFLQVLVNVYNLRFSKNGGYLLRTVTVVLGFTLAFTLIAALAVALFQPSRLPPVYTARQTLGEMNFVGIIESLVPASFQKTMSGSLHYLPGLFLVAGVFGFALFELRGSVKNLVDLSMSMYRIVAKINIYIVRGLSVLIFIPVTNFVLTFRGMDNLGTFFSLFSVVALLLILFVVGVFPLLLFIKKGALSITSYIRLLFAPLIMALGGGSSLIAYPILFRNAQNLRLSFAGQKINLAVFVLFLKAGTAMVSVIVFMVLVLSHTSLEMSFTDFLVVISTITVLAPLLSFFPGPGLALILSTLTSVYGKGMGESYLIVQTVLPILGAMAAGLDVAVTAFSLSYFSYANIGVPDEQDRDGTRLLGEFYL